MSSRTAVPRIQAESEDEAAPVALRHAFLACRRQRRRRQRRQAWCDRGSRGVWLLAARRPLRLSGIGRLCHRCGRGLKALAAEPTPNSSRRPA